VADGPNIRASLFVTCLVDQLFPQVGVSTVQLLRRLGVEVDFPTDQTCCGQAVFNSGFRKEAKKLGSRVIKAFDPGSDPPEGHYIVVPSGSCAAMMRVFYPALFEDDRSLHKRAVALAGRVYELSEFLVKVLGVTDVGATYTGRITYHPSCHLLRELNISREPVELLERVRGAEMVQMDQADTCCGFGGTFSVKYPHISEGMLEDKIASLVSTGATTLVGCDISCLMHIGGALHRQQIDVKTLHLAQILEGEGA